MLSLDLGKKPFHKFTKSALIDMLEDAILAEKKRSLPAHKRGEEEKNEKHEDETEADEEREKAADQYEESHGKPAPIDMVDEDMSDEAMDKIKSKVASKTKKAK